MATTELPHDHHHDHPAFLAHHFETPEQQFDSGKLGMWLFLVTEVLFFSGLFCAYAIFRAMRPEVFQFSSQFLNTTLGAINTGVLLFSSLTMAWAVRAAQKEQHKVLVGMLTATLSCAMIFLGVKAVEYSHKWDIGLLPAGYYAYSFDGEHGTGAGWLVMLSVVPALCLIGVAIWLAVAKVRGNVFHARIAGPLVIVAAFYFAGVGLGMVLEGGGEEHGDGAHASAVHDEHDHEEGHASVAAEEREPDVAAEPETGAADGAEEGDADASEARDVSVLGRLAEDAQNTGVRAELEARERQRRLAESPVQTGFAVAEAGEDPQRDAEVNTKQLAGVFFSIYYCMTGVHAIHIIAGIGVLVWLLVRAVRQDFNRQYFGPVDYVGLYWHLVDLIWIYLFPLLYLIG